MTKPITVDFEGWFTILIPKHWKYENDEGLINFYSTKNPKGALQFSLYRRVENVPPVSKFVMDRLEGFIAKNNIDYDVNTKIVIEGPYFAVASVSGIMDNSFINVWTLANHEKYLLITYIGERKTKELSTAEDIVYNIRLY
jgi:hypothetical protein